MHPFYKNMEYFESNKITHTIAQLLNLPISTGFYTYDLLKKYLDNPNLKPEYTKFFEDKLNIIDDYRKEQIVFKLNDIKYKIIFNEGKAKHIISCLGIDKENKVINISNKYLSYMPIIESHINEDAENLTNVYNDLVNNNIDEVIEEDVFLFIDCYSYAPVHNLDDIYNTLYMYKKNNMKCKLLVIKTTNFYYNQTLISINNYFNLEYIFLDFNRIYLFKNLYCTRQYTFLQREAKKFIDTEYISKIINKYNYDIAINNIAIIKYEEPTNVSKWDTFDKSTKFLNFCKKHTIVDININYKNDLEYKIYLINKAKKIIVNYFSPFNVNIFKHCINLSNKEIYLINGGNQPQYTTLNEFEKISENLYNTYGRQMRGEVFNNIKTLDEVVDKLEKYFI